MKKLGAQILVGATIVNVVIASWMFLLPANQPARPMPIAGLIALVSLWTGILILPVSFSQLRQGRVGVGCGFLLAVAIPYVIGSAIMLILANWRGITLLP